MTMTPQQPEGRDLFDFAEAVNAGQHLPPQTDLERTYLHVQQTMQGASTHLTSTTKDSTWENVMNTLALAPVAPVSNRTKRERGIAAAPVRRTRWTPLASIAAALLVIAASVGFWSMLGSDGQPPRTTTREAPQLAAFVPVPATPVATAIYDTASCPGIGDAAVTVLEEGDEVDADAEDVLVWLSDGGTVTARCPGGEEIVLAEGMNYLQVTNLRQIVAYGQMNELHSARIYHHLGLGKTITDIWSLTPTVHNSGPFMGYTKAIISAKDSSQWSIANFETMEEITLEEAAGVRIHSSQSISVAMSGDGHTAIAIAVSMYETEGSASLLRILGAPGDVVVVSSDFSQSHWLTLPDSLPGATNIRLSNDGAELTFQYDVDPQSQGDGIDHVTVDVETGEVTSD